VCSFVFIVLFFGSVGLVCVLCFVFWSSNAPINNNRHRCKYKQRNSLFYCCAFKFDTIHAISTHLRAHTTTLALSLRTWSLHRICMCVYFRAFFPAAPGLFCFFEFCINFRPFRSVCFDLVFRQGFSRFSHFSHTQAVVCAFLPVSFRSSPLWCEHFSVLIKIGKQNRIKFPDRQQIRVKTLRKLRAKTLWGQFG